MLRAFAHHVVCCCVLLRLVGSCWMKFDQFQTSSNNFQQVATTHNMVCKRSQHVGPNIVASCWPTMLRAFARAFKSLLRQCATQDLLSKEIFIVSRMSNRLAEPPRTCCVSRRYIRLRQLPSQLMLWHIEDVSNFRQIFLFQSGFGENKIATRLHPPPLFFCLSSPTFWELRDQPFPCVTSLPSLPLGWWDERPWEKGFPNAIKLNRSSESNQQLK